MITKIAFVSHPTQDMATSKKFFGDVLGLKLTSTYEDKWCEFDTPDGKSIALDTFTPPGKGPYLALETDDIEKELKRLRKHGVPVVVDLMDNKVCKMAIVQDPNGHALMLHQMAPKRLKALEAAKQKAAKTASKPEARSKPAAAKPAAAKSAAAKPTAAKPTAAKPTAAKSAAAKSAAKSKAAPKKAAQKPARRR
jgi:predicted enzyme related to lactoylglutathione lyase